jgi:6-phosphogluconolactonase
MGKFVYAANVGSKNVSAYKIKSSGALKSVVGSPFDAKKDPYGTAVDPTGKFAYVSNNGSNDVSAYTINATTGALTPVAGSPFGAGSRPRGMATCGRVGSKCKPPP